MRTNVDCRLGGAPRYFVGDRRDMHMRLPDDVRKCVAFLGRQEAVRDAPGAQPRKQFVPYGTGFLVAVPSSRYAGFGQVYLVTGKHVADHLEPDFEIRLNDKSGKLQPIPVSGCRWATHKEDPSIDVAAIAWEPPPEIDYLALTPDIFMDVDRMPEKGIGTGDEVYVTGLFAPVTGVRRIEPIVRSGHVAMIPADRVPVSDWPTNSMEAFLIEMRSLGGLSGSPVFVQRSIQVVPAEPSGRAPLAAGAIFLLGLMHGHWRFAKDSIDYAAESFVKDAGKDGLLNAGIAVVAPARHIRSLLLEHPDLVKAMEKSESEHASRFPVSRDTGAEPGGHRLSAATSTIEPASLTSSDPGAGWFTRDDASVPAAPTSAESFDNEAPFRRMLRAASTKKPKGGRT